MSQSDEDIELRELVTEALEKSGVLAAVRAHLRAGVFLALEREHEQKQSGPLQQVLESRDGLLALLLVQELLDFCQLRHTSSVYRAETGQPSSFSFQGRDKLISDYKLNKFSDSCNMPLLVQLISVFLSMNKKSSNPQTKVDNSVKQDSSKIAQNNSFVFNNSDNYDTTFTSDSTSLSIPEEKNKVVLNLNLNHSSESNKSSLDNKSSHLSENSIHNDTRIELQTDSEKSINSDSDSISNSKHSENDIKDHLDAAALPDLSEKNDLVDTIENHSVDTVSEVGKKSVKSHRNSTKSDNISELLQNSDESTNLTLQTLGHKKNHSSQFSNRTDLSEESIREEIISYDNDFEDESNIINKLTASSGHSFNFSINEVVLSADLSKKSSITDRSYDDYKSSTNESIPESVKIKPQVEQKKGSQKTINQENAPNKGKINKSVNIKGNGKSNNGVHQEIGIGSDFSLGNSESVSSHGKMNGSD